MCKIKDCQPIIILKEMNNLLWELLILSSNIVRILLLPPFDLKEKHEVEEGKVEK